MKTARATHRSLAATRGASYDAPLAAALALLCALAGAANAAPLRFTALDSSAGLSENTVTSVVEDREGFLWVGTQDGLNRFDGVDFKAYKTGRDAARELVEDYVNVLHVDRDGAIWVGTFAGGLSRFDPRVGTFENFLHDPARPDSLAHNDVGALLELGVDQDPRGAIYVATRGGGLDRLDPATKKITHVPLAPELKHVSALARAPDGGLWLGTFGAGLVELAADLTPRRHLRFGTEDALALPSDDISAIAYDTNGALWIGTRRDGVAQLSATGRLKSYRHDAKRAQSLAHDAVNALYVDRGGRVWVGTSQGLDLYDPAVDGFRHNAHAPDDPSSMPHNEVLAVYEDTLGTLWVGTGGRGVARHVERSKQFEMLGHDPADPGSLGGGGAWSVVEESDGRLWVGTLSGGLYERAPGSAAFTQHAFDAQADASISDNDVRALLADGSGGLWVGTRRGLNRYDPATKRFTRYFRDVAKPDSLGHDFVRALLRDGSGGMWVGTYGGGLDRYDAATDTFVHHRHDPARADSLSDDRIYSLLAARDGALWVGTHGGGLNRFDPETGRALRLRHSPGAATTLASDRVLSLHEARDGTIWVGSSGGLDRLDPATNAITRQATIGTESVLGIVEDGAGALWFSTNDGVVRYDPVQEQMRRYTLSERLDSTEFNGGAVFRSPTGRIYFGGVEGVVAIEPAFVATALTQVVPTLTDFLLFNRPARPRAFDPQSPLTAPIGFIERLELAHDHKTFGFAFAALRAVDPARHTFRYRLDGLDERWIETTARQRTATFTNVPPGDYVFEVKASDAEGRWLPARAKVGVTIRPAPWRTPWAYLAYALAAAALVGFVLRQRWLREQQKLAAQAAIAEREERLSLAVWGSGDELFDWDLAAGTLLRVGGDAARRTHRTEGLTSAEDFARFLHADDLPGFRTVLADHLEGRTPHFETSYRLRSPSGTWDWKLARGMIVERDDHGRALRISGMQKDISRIKAVETALVELTNELDARVHDRTRELSIRQGELEAANTQLEAIIEELRRTQTELIEAEKMASLGRLVAGVAHEVNTPLGVGVTALSYLRGQLAALKTTLARHLHPEQADTLISPLEDAGAMVESNLFRAANLVKSFKQVAVDQSTSGIRSVDVCEYVEGTLQSLHPQLRKTRHQVRIECPAGIEMTSRPDAFYQVIVNLVMNSLVHAFPDGRDGTLVLSVLAEGANLRLVYTDDGVGMTPEVARRVFEPFFTTKREAGGSGLGMHIVYNLVVQALAGRITCASTPGEGVRFEIVFPRVHPQTARAIPAQ